jgi:hypothetical protein
LKEVVKEIGDIQLGNRWLAGGVYMMMRLPLAIAAVLLFLSGCGAGQAPQGAGPGTGIEGVVTLGPTTPVCRAGTPCSRPVAATIAVRDAAGRQVLQFTSGADGRFRVDLAPGTYTLAPLPLRAGSPFPRPVPATVTVTAGSYAHAEVTYDTGIR